MSVYARNSRIEKSDEAINQAEMAWWNENAPLIERIWGLPEIICNESRKHYLEYIRHRFRDGVPSEKVLKILEVACGSGWPGRLLADFKTHVIGVDFSQEQIRLAEQNAKTSLAPGAVYCSYIQSEVKSLPRLMQNNSYDGVFIHCGLHHLSFEELVDFAADLEKLPSGFKVILVEPMYHDKVKGLAGLFRIVGEAFWRIFFRLVLKKERLDPEIEEQTQKLLTKATKQGWFLSPKEMPFTVQEINTLFDRHFHIRAVEPVTHFSLRLAIFLGTLQSVPRAEVLARRWLPFFNFLDRILIKSGLMPFLSKDYFFTMIELVKK